jgi:hypothetical protein
VARGAQADGAASFAEAGLVPNAVLNLTPA